MRDRSSSAARTVLTGSRAAALRARCIRYAKPLRVVGATRGASQKDSVLYMAAVSVVVLRRRFVADGCALMHHEEPLAMVLPVFWRSKRLPVVGRVDASHSTSIAMLSVTRRSVFAASLLVTLEGTIKGWVTPSRRL